MSRAPAEERVQQARQLTSVEEARELYREWAADYDADIAEKLQFTGATDIAEMLCEWLTNRSARIIDLGCGTGLVGAELQRLGYAELDGLDLSPEMLDVARSKHIYKHLIEADLEQPLDIADAAYDGVISAGTFTTGHINARRLDEIFRIIKPGGWLGCVVAKDFWREGGFPMVFSRLESSGQVASFQYTIRPISNIDTSSAYFCIALVGTPHDRRII